MAYESDFSAGADDLGGSYSGARWSYHYARPQAGWTESSAVEAYFKRIADDPTIDPGATMAAWEAAYIAEANRLGIRPDAGSAENILNYVRLQVGETSWRQIAGSAGTTAPSGAGALASNYIDTVNARESAAIAGIASQLDPNDYNGDDAAILSMLRASGADFTSGIASPSLALSPVPAPEMRAAMALGQSSQPTASPYASLSSFAGFGPRGTAYDFAGGGGGGGVTEIDLTRPRGGGIPWILIIVAAGAAYFLLKKG